MTELINIQWRNRMVVAAIFLIFLLPVLLARFVMFNTNYNRDAGSGTQHGILISPPRALKNQDLVDPITGIKTTLYGKWTMFAQIEGDCDRDCKETLYRMRQIQIAMGEKFFRVQRVVYFSGEGVESDAKNIFSGFDGQLMLAHDGTWADFRKNFLMAGKKSDHAIYLIDPRGFLMMCYPKDTNPSGIIKDLQRLLGATGQ